MQKWYPRILWWISGLDVLEQSKWLKKADFPEPGFPVIKTPRL